MNSDQLGSKLSSPSIPPDRKRPNPSRRNSEGSRVQAAANSAAAALSSSKQEKENGNPSSFRIPKKLASNSATASSNPFGRDMTNPSASRLQTADSRSANSRLAVLERQNPNPDVGSSRRGTLPASGPQMTTPRSGALEQPPSVSIQAVTCTHCKRILTPLMAYSCVVGHRFCHVCKGPGRFGPECKKCLVSKEAHKIRPRPLKLEAHADLRELQKYMRKCKACGMFYYNFGKANHLFYCVPNR